MPDGDDIQIDPNDIYLHLIRNPTGNKAEKKKLYKEQLEEGFSENWNEYVKDPDMYVTMMGDTVMLNLCEQCNAPHILHVPSDEECKLEPFPSQSNSKMTVYLDQIEQYTAVKAVAIYWREKNKKSEPVPSVTQNITNEKRSRLPQYTKDNWTHWQGLVNSWNTLYPDVKPLDKYMEIIEALQKGGGEELATKIQSEGLDYNDKDIIKYVLERLTSYLEKTVMTAAEAINQKWNELRRGDHETTIEFMNRYDLICLQQKEIGLLMNEKQRAIQLFTKANLCANSRNIVIAQVDLNSRGAAAQMKNAILNVTPTGGANGTPGSYYSDRGRTMNRDQRGRSRSYSSSYQFRYRCPCGDCKTHDKKYNERRSSAGPTGRDRTYSNTRKENNAGNVSDTFVSSVYLNLAGQQIVIDTGCVRNLMSKHDVPYLESLIGRKLEPTGKSYGVKFGDNKTSQTEAVVMVPFWDGKKLIDMEVGIVNDRIPFLLGLLFLRKLNGRIVIDDRLELENGAVYKMTGGGNGHQKIEWSHSLHCGPNKVISSSDMNRDKTYIENTECHENLTDPEYADFFNEDEIICFKADITVNTRDRLYDDISSNELEHFTPLCRKGSYSDADTDSVYLYRNNLTENLPVSSPFEYSDIGEGILKVMHDRGIRNGIDIDELEEVYKEKPCQKVLFDNTASKIIFDPHEPTTFRRQKTYVEIKDHTNSLYKKMTKKPLDIPIDMGEKISKTDDDIYYLPDVKPANKALPVEMCFYIRSSGQITYLQTSEMTQGSENMNFKTFIETKTGMKSSFDDNNSKLLSEHILDDGTLEKALESSKENRDFDEYSKVYDFDNYSQKQVHDAHKKKAQKKKAVRGHKKSSQSLKPDSNIPEIKTAMIDEIEKFKKFDVFEEVSDSPYIYKVPSNWVVTEKDCKKEGENKYKCRLVALGNLDRKINLKATDSPTLSRETLRLILSTIANLEFQLQGCDISSAFLQGQPLDRQVFMNPPKEFRTPGKVWLLKKPVYGLADAGRLWYRRLRDEILNSGCTELTGDAACFLYHNNGRLQGIIGTHVDDIIYGGTPEFEESIIKPLMNTFNISKTDHDSFVFCGMSLRQNSDYSITVSQTDYAETIEGLPDYKDMTDAEKTTLLKSVAGQVSYLSLTRPDLMFQSSELLRVGKTLDERLKLAEILLQKVKNGTGEIIFKKLGHPDTLELMCYADASFNNIKYGKVSTAGCVILLKGNFGTCAPILWVSKPIIRVTRSTMAAEARALELAVDYAILFSRQIKEIYSGNRTTKGIPVSAFTDSHTLHDAIVSTRQIEEKALIHLIYCLKDKVLYDEVRRVTWVKTKDQLADGLTKGNVQMDKLLSMIRSGIFPKSMLC